LVADVVISSAHADIKCGECGPPRGDFVAGTGKFINNGGNAEFVLAAGIKDQGGLFGHLIFNDFGTGVRVESTKITGYSIVDAKTRRITGTAKINGQPGTFILIVSDKANPGAGFDTFEIKLSTGYQVKGTLVQGNIELSARPPDCR
jgi:hypothetical protein